MGGDVGEEGEGFGEGGGEGDAADAVAGGGWEGGLGAREEGDAAAAFVVADEAGVDGCLADEGVAAVDCRGDCGVFFGCGGASDHVGLISDLLVAHCVVFEHLHAFAVCRTAESEGGIVEWATSITVEAAFVVHVPECCTAPDALRFPISFNVPSFCGMVQDQDESQQPAKVEERQ